MNRIEWLKQNLNQTDRTAQVVEYKKIAQIVYEGNINQAEIIRKAEFLQKFAEQMPAKIHSKELIVGTMGFLHWCPERSNGFYGNLGHVIVDYGYLLKRGLLKVKQEINEIQDFEQNKTAFQMTIDAFSAYISKVSNEAHKMAELENEPDRKAELITIGENCAWISENAPKNFWQALQLVWFIQIFLHAEGNASAVSFGRFDQYLLSFYQQDLQSGIISREQAKELLSCFWLKTCEGDESQNLTLGGEGENDLSLLCLEVAASLRVWRPSVSVRICEKTSDDFWHNTLQLIRAGIGMPALFNDKIIIKALECAGIESKDAKDYGIVGCYEATPNGNALGLTVAGELLLHDILLRFLEENLQGFTGFEEMILAFENYFTQVYKNEISKDYHKRWLEMKEKFVSPFESICLCGCIISGLAAEQGGAKYTMFGINVLGLGTLTDSLYAMKVLIFDRQEISWKHFLAELKNNFSDDYFFYLCRNLKGKYGSDNEYTNQLSARLATLTAKLVLDNRFDPHVITYPGLFRFTADIYAQNIPATPDGRRMGERVSYGIAASDFCAEKTITSVLSSAANIPNDLCACGNPVIVSLCQDDVKEDAVLRGLVQGYFSDGGFHLQFNIVSADVLKDAQLHPENYDDLIIRISGYSHKFKWLHVTMQNALIERTQNGG